MELTKIEGTTLVSQYPSIQSENMTKLENHANSVDDTLDEHSTDIAKLQALGLYIDSDGDIAQL